VARLLAELAGFIVLLFVTRFVARGHLVLRMDQECHIGGIALDVLAHGIRFPLTVYAPNEYDNGSFFSGLLTAASFLLLGRNVLALKLVTHVISAAGAVATLSLLRGCLRELKLTDRRTRWVATAVLVIAIASAPRVVTIFNTYAVGNHAEGSAIDTLLLAFFALRWHMRSPPRTAAFWAVVGFALYLNKGTLLVIPVLAVLEAALSWHSPGRLVAACVGFVLGAVAEMKTVLVQFGAGWGYMGWTTILAKEQRNVRGFPHAFLSSIWFLSEYRWVLLATWILALGVAIALLVRVCLRVREAHAAGQSNRVPADVALPVALALTVGVSCFHLIALAAMAKDGLDAYVIYGYPTLVVAFSLLVALIHRLIAARSSRATGNWAGLALVAATLVLYRADAVTWRSGHVSALWHNQAGATCWWRFAEGFEREVEYGLSSGRTREEHAVDRCRSLSEEAQVLDCIGGIARELQWRQPDGRVRGEPPAGLSSAEELAYAYLYGTHRKGDAAACGDFADPSLVTACSAAVELECLHYADTYTRIAKAQGLAPPRCTIPEPPMDGFWAVRRLDLMNATAGTVPHLEYARGDDDLSACEPVFRRCY
jgi:hypothetical protein